MHDLLKSQKETVHWVTGFGMGTGLDDPTPRGTGEESDDDSICSPSLFLLMFNLFMKSIQTRFQAGLLLDRSSCGYDSKCF